VGKADAGYSKMAETDLESHFGFGENWADFSNSITDQSIEDARQGLMKLVGPDLGGKTFLDIGCGSGIHALAALKLGASSVVATDIDPISVETTGKVLDRHAPAGKWRAETISVLSPQFERLGQFDVVYSWGVLHHTGAMCEAIAKAAGATKPGGKFVIAIYAKTNLCSFWKAEKRIYSRAPKLGQAVMRGIFHLWRALIVLLVAVKNRRAPSFSSDKSRGMKNDTDIHDWLGGYPYESAAPAEILALAKELGLKSDLILPVPGNRIGLLGSGCDEYVFVRG
jgi:2-polyprenyl-3-methyl-5-hydroxy-6-metoxy-1,4-benzoquinol methylase